MTKSKKSFLLHIDSLEILEELNDEQAGRLFKAIAAFHKGEAIELDPLVKVAFSPFKNQFIRDDQKYQETCRKRAEAGAKGGAKSRRGSSKQDEEENKQLLANASNDKQTEANKADNKNKTNSDSDSDSDSDKKPIVQTPEGVSVADQNQAFSIFQYWCSVMGKHIGSCKLTPKREKAIKARLKEGYTAEQIKQAIDGCKKDPFSMGKNDRGKPFNDIELICRTGEKLESFIPEDTDQTENQFSGKTGRNIQMLKGLNLDE